MPAGALNCLLDCEQTDAGPVIEQAGSGLTATAIVPRLLARGGGGWALELTRGGQTTRGLAVTAASL